MEDKALFNSSAVVIDQHCTRISQGNLPSKQVRDLHAYITELALVVSKHFNTYAKGAAPSNFKLSVSESGNLKLQTLMRASQTASVQIPLNNNKGPMARTVTPARGFLYKPGSEIVLNARLWEVE